MGKKILIVIKNSLVVLLILNYKIINGISVSVGIFWIICRVVLSRVDVIFDELFNKFRKSFKFLFINRLSKVWFVLICICF